MTHIRDKRLWLAAALGVAGLGALLMPGATVQAADHGDPFAMDSPDRLGPADIADFYAWHDATNVKFIITYAGLAPAGDGPVYNADVLYQIHINTNPGLFDEGYAGAPPEVPAVPDDPETDQTDDFTINIRFAQNAAGDWGVQAEGVPGAATIEGAVDTNINEGGVMLHAGLHDDPFFFDLVGFQDTVRTGVVSFDSVDMGSPTDVAAGLNAMGIVLEFPKSAIGSATFDTWASTSQIGS